MKVTFSYGAGPTVATLCDISATPKLSGIIEKLGGASGVQSEDLYNSANKFLAPLGNVGGQFVFTAGCSYADVSTASAAFKAAYALLNLQGTVVYTPVTGATTITFANAILRDVQAAKWDGKWLNLRYTFETTTVT